MTAPSKLAVEIAEAVTPYAGDRIIIATLIDAKIRPLVEDGARANILREHLSVLTTTIFDYDRCQRGIGELGMLGHERFKDCIPVPKEILAATHKALDFDQARAQRPAQEGSK